MEANGSEWKRIEKKPFEWDLYEKCEFAFQAIWSQTNVISANRNNAIASIERLLDLSAVFITEFIDFLSP